MHLKGKNVSWRAGAQFLLEYALEKSYKGVKTSHERTCNFCVNMLLKGAKMSFEGHETTYISLPQYSHPVKLAILSASW